LEKAGLIERRPNPSDKRGTLVALTADGLELIEKAVVAHVANQHLIVDGLSKDEQETLSALLEKLLSSQR
jgi:DNA-binding MarR family transcriptional regulator